MGLDALSLESYRRVEADADRASRFELRWVSTLEHAAAVAVTCGGTFDEFVDEAKRAIRRAERELADRKRAIMKQMTEKKPTKRRTT